VAAVIISGQLHAQADTTAKILDEVLLTTNKYPKKQSETAKVVTIISAQQLEESKGKTLGELLNTVAGVTIPGANNDPGTNLTTNIRGGAAGNALILIDGLPLNDPSVNNNYFDLNYFAIDQIERIEILKGGQSTLYGSDAVNGVVNIITKKAGSKKFNVSANITAGSYNTFKQYAGLSGRNGKMNYILNYTHYSSAGFSSAYDSTGKQNFDKDGFDQHVVSGSMEWTFSTKVKAKIFGTYGYYKTDLDAAAFTDEKDYTVKNNNGQLGAALQYQHTNGIMHLNYFFNYVSRDYLDDSTYRSDPFVDFSQATYIGRTHFAEWYDNWNFGKWELLTGMDYRLNNTFQQYFSTGSFGPYAPPVLNKKIEQLSPYASAVYKSKDGLNLELGGRWNHHSVYGNNFTFTFNPSLLMKNKTKFFVNLYSAYKIPTLYQLFDPSAGNKNLQPEKGIITEAGVEILATHSFHSRIVGFYHDTKNSILYTYNPSTFASLYINAGNQKDYGAELEATFKTNRWELNANYTYTDGRSRSAYDGTGAPIGKDSSYYNLYRIPKNVVNLNVAFRASKDLLISTQLHVSGKRVEFIYGSVPDQLKGYVIASVYSEYKMSKEFKIFLDLKNITDTKYFDFPGYNSKRFNFTAGISFNR
jgi:vitamin B12 transporter